MISSDQSASPNFVLPGIAAMPADYQPSIQFTTRRNRKSRKAVHAASSVDGPPITTRGAERRRAAEAVISLDDDDDGSALLGGDDTLHRRIARTAPSIMNRHRSSIVLTATASVEPPSRKNRRKSNHASVAVDAAAPSHRRKQALQPTAEGKEEYILARVAEADDYRRPRGSGPSSMSTKSIGKGVACLPGGLVALLRFHPSFNRGAIGRLSISGRTLIRNVYDGVDKDYGACLAEQTVAEATSALTGVPLTLVQEVVDAASTSAQNPNDASTTAPKRSKNPVNVSILDKLNCDTRTIMYTVYRNMLATTNIVHSTVRRIDLVDIVARLTHFRAGSIYRLLRAARGQWLDDHKLAKMTLTKNTSALFLPGKTNFEFRAETLKKIEAMRRTPLNGKASTACSEREKFGIDGRMLRRLRRCYSFVRRRRPSFTERDILWVVCRQMRLSLMHPDTLKTIILPCNAMQKAVIVTPSG